MLNNLEKLENERASKSAALNNANKELFNAIKHALQYHNKRHDETEKLTSEHAAALNSARDANERLKTRLNYLEDRIATLEKPATAKANAIRTEPLATTSGEATTIATPPPPPTPAEPEHPSATNLPVYNVLLIVGHNAIVQGAYSKHLQQSEYEFNLALARSLEGSSDAIFADTNSKDYVANLNVHILYREHNTTHANYTEIFVDPYVNKHNIDICIELHFNSFHDEKAHGSELLHAITNYHKLQPLKLFHTAYIRNVNGIKSRGVKQLKPKDRGFTNATNLRNINNSTPYCLLEPFFGSNFVDCNIAKLSLRDAIHKALLEVAFNKGLEFHKNVLKAQ